MTLVIEPHAKFFMVGNPAAGASPVKSRQRVSSGVTTEQLIKRYRLRRSSAVLDAIVERHRAGVEAMAFALRVMVILLTTTILTQI